MRLFLLGLLATVHVHVGKNPTKSEAAFSRRDIMRCIARSIVIVLAICVAFTSVSAAPVASGAPASGASSDADKSLKDKLLRAFYTGASKLSKILPETTVGVPMFSSLKHEYEAMTKWWCEDGGRQASKFSSGDSSSFCARRQAKHAKPSAAAAAAAKPTAERKLETDEAKAMVAHFCRTPQGSPMQICVRSIGVMEASKRAFHRLHSRVQDAQNATADPSAFAARRAFALSG